ncbi:MAG: HAMP domain-containing sensor histidine kinase [Parvularculaceae bacterium]
MQNGSVNEHCPSAEPAERLPKGETLDGSLNIFSATFRDPQTEARFQQHLVVEAFDRQRLIHALGSLVFVAYGALDALVAGDLAAEFLIVRFLIAAPLSFAIIGIGWMRPFRQNFGVIAGLALFIYAAAVIYMIYRMPGPGAPPYIIGVLIVMIFAACLMRINFVFAAPTFASIAATYCFAIVLKEGMGREEIVSGFFFMISVACVAIATIYIQERRARESWIGAEQREIDAAVIRQLLLEATAADRSKTSFLAIVTHELRTPLHQIIGYSEVVRQQQDSDEARKHLDQVIHAAHELLKKVGKMLRYADATAGRLKIAREMCSLVEIIDQATEETRNSAQMRHVTIDASKVEEVKLFADHHQTACALQYIVENAIHASKPGATIVLEGARSAAGAYEMRIIDRGAGMSEKQLANAFLPFAQAEAGLARYREGLGLGLPIANLLLQAQQARLAIKSKLGEGTEVEIAFEAAALMRRDTAEAA